ncbi:YjfB family protein [Lachnospiraceae bacterium 42-17]|nr:putative motility protein [Dorea sp.]
MDIPALSTYMSMNNLSLNMDIAVMSKVLDTAEATGQALVQMADAIEGLGENIDIMA